MFDVVLYKFKYNDKDCTHSKHLDSERQQRNEFIEANFDLSNKNIANVFCVNKGHKHGIELHTIYNSGIIKVINPVSRKIVTYLIARPQQIKRYYEKCRLKVKYNESIIDVAYAHKLEGLNCI